MFDVVQKNVVELLALLTLDANLLSLLIFLLRGGVCAATLSYQTPATLTTAFNERRKCILELNATKQQVSRLLLAFSISRTKRLVSLLSYGSSLGFAGNVARLPVPSL